MMRNTGSIGSVGSTESIGSIGSIGSIVYTANIPPVKWIN